MDLHSCTYAYAEICLQYQQDNFENMLLKLIEGYASKYNTHMVR